MSADQSISSRSQDPSPKSPPERPLTYQGQPYVGVTGYTSVDQIDAVHRAARPVLGRRVLMDGLLIWAHDLDERWRQAVEAPADFPRRFASISAAAGITQQPSDISLRLVHFRTGHERLLDEQLAQCVDRLGPYLDGFQINWLKQPHPGELAEFRRHHNARRRESKLPPGVMVLQLHPQLLAMTGEAMTLVRYLEPYVGNDAVTHVLFDPSGGLGRRFNPPVAVQALRQLRSAFPQLHLGVAGGLGPDNVDELLRPVWTADANVSIDVEGRIRHSHTDEFDSDKAAQFVSRSLDLAASLEALVPEL